MRFHKGRRFGLPEEEQGYLYWKCRNYFRLSLPEQQIIKAAILKASPDYSDAVFEAVTTERSLWSVALRHNISESALFPYVRDFYKILAKK